MIKTIRSDIRWEELEDFVKEYIYREVGDEDMNDEEWAPILEDLNETTYSLYEYDPKVSLDRTILEGLLQGKIRSERGPRPPCRRQYWPLRTYNRSHFYGVKSVLRAATDWQRLLNTA